MTNLFGAFDPSSLLGTSLNWGSSALVLLFLPCSLFAQTSRSLSFWKNFTTILHLEFSSVMGTQMKPGSTWFIISFFLFIFLNNSLGLFPYVFTSTSHMSFAMALAVPLWLGHMALSWAKQTEYALAHLVPTGTPVALMAFMVLIELTSNLIRPLTLSVRLMANLTAGHLLLCLLSSNLALATLNPGAALVLAGLVVLVALEIAVSLIQAYVFTLLMSLYLGEVQTKTVMA